VTGWEVVIKIIVPLVSVLLSGSCIGVIHTVMKDRRVDKERIAEHERAYAAHQDAIAKMCSRSFRYNLKRQIVCVTRNWKDANYSRIQLRLDCEELQEDMQLYTDSGQNHATQTMYIKLFKDMREDDAVSSWSIDVLWIESLSDALA
jgi:hypothetical protein